MYSNKVKTRDNPQPIDRITYYIANFRNGGDNNG